VDSFALYSDRVNGPAPRVREELPDATSKALVQLVRSRIDADWLALEFPGQCPDGRGVSGTDIGALSAHLQALVPGLEWPLWRDANLSDDTVFDLVEYAGARLALPVEGPYHDFYGHHELTFDRDEGRERFSRDVNEILARGGTVFELDPQMQIQRRGTAEVHAVLDRLRPATGDPTLDALVEQARRGYLSRKKTERAVAIEKLWDAFERLKTLDVPADKRASVQALLGHITDPALRQTVEAEMTALTNFGNNFTIRHHEVGKTPIPSDADDYVAARMSNLLVFLLAQSKRLTQSS
jgi:hypothetical protein